MAKHKGHKEVEVNVVRDREREDKEYRNNYQFKEKGSVRSPVSGWEEEMVKRDDPYFGVSPKEKALVVGSKSTFGHKGSQIQGKLRTSGKGHQIGKK